MAVLNSKAKNEFSNKFGCSKNKTFVRNNGWQCPHHPLQILAWFVVVMFATVYLVFMVPAMPTSLLRGLALGVNLVLFAIHFVLHVAAISINPADDNVIEKMKSRRGPPAAFDRTKHAHVIENQFCYICEVSVVAKSKHCSICNKCVSDFDHHCKWLNNCVGGKNYKLFLSCVISGLVGSISVCTSSLFLTTAYFSKESWLYDNPKFIFFTNNSTMSTNESQTQHNLQTAWIIVVISILILSLVAFALLAHLLGFHIFLNCVGLSTYEFIVHQRSSNTASENSGQNLLMEYLRSIIFMCCMRKRVQPTQQPSQNQSTTNLKTEPMTIKQTKNTELEANNQTNGPSESSVYIKEARKTHNVETSAPLLTINEGDATNETTIDFENVGDNLVKRKSQKEQPDISKIISLDLTETQQNKNHIDLTKPSVNRNKLLQNISMKHDPKPGVDTSLPILNTIYQSGRMSRLSYASKNELGSRSMTPDDADKLNVMFFRRQSIDRFTPSPVRLNQTIRIPLGGLSNTSSLSVITSIDDVNSLSSNNIKEK